MDKRCYNKEKNIITFNRVLSFVFSLPKRNRTNKGNYRSIPFYCGTSPFVHLTLLSPLKGLLYSGERGTRLFLGPENRVSPPCS